MSRTQGWSPEAPQTRHPQRRPGLTQAESHIPGETRGLAGTWVQVKKGRSPGTGELLFSKSEHRAPHVDKAMPGHRL